MAGIRTTEAEATALPILLRTVVGSVIHGTNLPGSGDVDHMAIAAESRSSVLGLDVAPDSWNFRSAWSRAQEEGSDPRSLPGDLDLVVYPARKWARLAAQGNPSILGPLFADDRHVILSDEFGEELRANRHRFVSKSAAERHRAYMSAQRGRMLDDRGMRVSRPELVEAHGYDTKYAAHVIRLGVQGLAILTDHDIPMPLDPETSEYVRSIRRGEVPMSEVVAESERLEGEIASKLATSDLPEFADVEWLSDWLARMQLTLWSANAA